MKNKFTKKEINQFYKTLDEFELKLELKGNKKQKKALDVLLDPDRKYAHINEVGLGGGAG